MRVFLDSYAWVEYFLGSSKGEKVNILLTSENKIYTSNIVLAEVVSKFKREKMDFKEAIRIILSNACVVDVDKNIAIEAGIFHADIKKKKKDFGLVDAIIWISAQNLNSKIVTGDNHFKEFKNVIFLK